jgi:hypothetical protein
MYEDSQQFQHQIIPKKANKIDDDDSHRKKGKKGKRRDNGEEPEERPVRRE